MDAVVDIVDNHGTTIEPETSKLTDEDIDASTTSHREAIGFNVGLRKRLRNQMLITSSLSSVTSCLASNLSESMRHLMCMKEQDLSKPGLIYLAQGLRR